MHTPRQGKFTARLICGFLGVLAASNAFALSLEEIQGAWGASEVPCDEVFTVKNGRASLARSFGQASGGFIVDGRQVLTPNATCRMLSSRENGDVVTFVLDCRSEISFDTTRLSLRFLDADTLVRAHAAFPEMDAKYRRCK